MNITTTISMAQAPSSLPLTLRKTESLAYPNRPVDKVNKMLFYLKKHTNVVIVLSTLIFFCGVITLGPNSTSDLYGRSMRGSASKKKAAAHWGGAMHAGTFVQSSFTHDGQIAFAAVTDLDQKSKLQDNPEKPSFKSLLLHGSLTKDDSHNHKKNKTNNNNNKLYTIHLGDATKSNTHNLITKHNEAGRGGEFSELTLYQNRLLTFDDRTGDVFEILMDNKPHVVPRFVITEGQGDEEKGMKWEWSTVKDNKLYMGSMGKEYTNSQGQIVNENNLWVGILDEFSNLERVNWKPVFDVVRSALGARSPGYIIVEAVLWSDSLQQWVFLPRRISKTQYDEDEDEQKGGLKLVLLKEDFTDPKVVDIDLPVDGYRGFSSFAFVPGSNDQHALAIRSVEEHCTGAMADCTQRSFFSVFHVLTGQRLADEVEYEQQMKFEGVEFVDVFAGTATTAH